MHNSVIFIVGISGSGKTTLSKALQEKLKNWYVYDFDSVGVPKPVPSTWRLQTLTHWIEKAKTHQVKGEKMVLLGQFNPSDIKLIDKSFIPYFLFLKISENTLRTRQNARGRSEEKIKSYIAWMSNMESEVVSNNGTIIDADISVEQVADSIMHVLETTHLR